MSPAGIIFHELKNLAPIKAVSDPEVPANLKNKPDLPYLILSFVEYRL